MKIKAPPVDGKANSAIEEFFAEFLGVSKRDVTVLKGEKSKAKKLLIRNLSKDEILHKLSLTPAG